MDRLLLFLFWASILLAGAALIFYAKWLSRGYNAWTTRLRTRYSRINPPPTQEMRELNTKIMTWLFRILGVFVFLYSLLGVLLIVLHNG